MTLTPVRLTRITAGHYQHGPYDIYAYNADLFGPLWVVALEGQNVGAYGSLREARADLPRLISLPDTSCDRCRLPAVTTRPAGGPGGVELLYCGHHADEWDLTCERCEMVRDTTHPRPNGDDLCDECVAELEAEENGDLLRCEGCWNLFAFEGLENLSEDAAELGLFCSECAENQRDSGALSELV